VPEAQTLPWSWYGDPEVLRRERDAIFRRSWQYVAHAEELARPGDYVARWAGHVPVAVVRNGAELRAFVNVCRHRGHEVVRGAGNRRTLQCPYHAWTYGLDGTLRAAPRSEREEDFDPSEISLVPVAVETFGPFVFVNPDADAAPLADVLGDLPERLGASGLDLAGLRFRERSEYELAANWKVVVENYLECYHCPVAHPGFSAMVDVDPDVYTLEASEWFSAQLGPAREPDGELPAGHFFFVWPNLRINVFPGRPNLAIGPALPDGPERTRGFFDYFFPDDVPEKSVRELIELDGQVGREDRELVESVQRGVASGVLDEGRLLLSSEHLIAHFQALVRRALA
jgi:choline monooxygenase